jgi:aryl-alcohol dehydrogenase-like predicted oxidoreductase
VLTGKYKPGEDPPEDSRATSEAMGNFITDYMRDPTLEAVQRLAPVAEEAGISMTELALAWTLRRPELASAIIGASRPEQVRANVAASGIKLSQDTLDAIDEALGDAVISGQRLGHNATSGVKHR